MPASERLKALDADIERSGTRLHDGTIRRVLPQIVAVVEAAENVTYDQDDEIGKQEYERVRRALSALEEALGGDVT